jgi:hypothetical protein
VDPKTRKVGLADMAISIASATPFLVTSLCVSKVPARLSRRRRLAASALASLAFAASRPELVSSIYVITAPQCVSTRPRSKTPAATRILQPSFLLDPSVRLHRLDENSSADISALLGYLRELQRRYDVAIIVVHHMRKATRAHLGQALRGLRSHA